MTASPSPDERVSIGTVLDGRYRIDAVLGSGGMGRVYRGEHTGIGRAVAIKVLHADLNRNREAAARFQREALASGRLDHPNIVGVSDFGVLDDGACFLVMEALDGESLGERLQRDKRIPWREALEVLRGVMAGLRHAHDRGVVHRDIKPDNVFLARKDGELVIKILDFGIAKLVAGSADDPAATRAGLTVGTPAYLSPEQAVGGEIKPASDIYSASILLFEMLTGRAPFEDKDPLAMLGAHVSRPPPALVEIVPALAAELPPGIEEMIQRGLQKAAADRIASATDYLAWIDAILKSPTTAVGSAPVIAPPLPGTPTPPPGTLGALASVGHAASLTLTPLPERASSPHAIQTGAAIRAVSLAETPPVPLRWIKLAVIILIAVVMIALVIAVVSRLRGEDEPTAPPPAEPPPKDLPKPKPKPKPIPGAKPAQPKPPPAAAPVTEPSPVKDDTTVKDDTKLKALLYELQNGKVCATRKAAIAKLVELDDPAAIPHVRSARYRMRGGMWGRGGENTNACLTKDADEAIKHLSRNLPPPAPKPQ